MMYNFAPVARYSYPPNPKYSLPNALAFRNLILWSFFVVRVYTVSKYILLKLSGRMTLNPFLYVLPVQAGVKISLRHRLRHTS